MKKVVFVLGVTILAGCSSMDYISTNKYSDELTEKCIQSLPASEQNDESKKKSCTLKAIGKMNAAERIYEFRAKADFKNCNDITKDKESAKACFAEAQEKYYEMASGLKK